MKKNILLVLFLFGTTGMNGLSVKASIPPDVVKALEQTGTHRPGLERLLKRYERQNSEKFQAACFLLTHASLHHTGGRVTGMEPQVAAFCQEAATAYRKTTRGLTDEARKDSRTQKQLKAQEDSLRNRLKGMQWKEPQFLPEKLCDLKFIDSTFLSDQIEQAFLQRKASPLARRLSLQDFFEYVLPYRSIGNYPLVYPASFYARWYADVLNSSATDDVETLVSRYNEAVTHGRRSLGNYPFRQRIGAYELFFSGLHDCVDQAYYGANVLRSCGIPALVVSNSANRFFLSNHFMVAVFDRKGRPCTFNPESSLPAYRFPYDQSLNLFYHYYSRRKENPASLAAEGEPIPSYLADPCIEDHTDWSVRTVRLTFPFHSSGRMRLAYLASFHPLNGLVAVTWGKVDAQRKTVTFEKVVPDNLYFPVICTGPHTLQGFAAPFLLVSDSTNRQGFRLQTYAEGNSKTVDTWLQRKFPIKRNMLKKAQQTYGTRVLGSDDYAFKKADTLFRMDFVPENDWQDIVLPAEKAYRHYRVLPPQGDSHVHISEIEYLTDRSRGYGNVVFPQPLVPHKWKNEEDSERWMRLLPESPEKMLKYKISDGDVTTSPETANHSIHLSQPQVIDRIRLTIQNAGNGLTYGDTYQLYEWREGTWQLLCTKMAVKGQWTSLPLHTGHLYWLHDLTQGTEEMPFLIDEKGQQTFPMQTFLYRIR